jgi:hypothetical protein
VSVNPARHEPGSLDTADSGVPLEPGREGSCARAQPGSEGGAGNQTDGPCMG